MLINLKPYDKIEIDSSIQMDIFENTIGIIDLSMAKIKGNVYSTHDTFELQLNVDLTVTVEDNNNHSIQNVDLSLNINEKEEFLKENLYIHKKTLDLCMKIWENIVVEIFNRPSKYNQSIIDGDGWKLYHDKVEDKGIDDRLKPLLDLLNRNEEV
ncbi:MAG: hypothetical protein ACK5NF_03820 [Bacilli bacterium]